MQRRPTADEMAVHRLQYFAVGAEIKALTSEAFSL